MHAAWTLLQATLLNDLESVAVLGGSHASFSESGVEPGNALREL
jgi:hypothetical protein